MWQELILVHRRESPEFPTAWKAQYAHWKTCLREIVLIPISDQVYKKDFHPNYDSMRGEKALRFLVEICAGLHSPVLGETEVFGQFRAQLSNFQHPDIRYEKQVQEFVQQVIDCTKRIREKCLSKGTSNSYGSLSRRFTKGYTSASFYGAGQLCAEILPWLENFTVTIHARKPAKALEVAAKHKRALIKEISTAPASEVLVVVAPVSAEAITSWVQLSEKKPKLILDLRGESANDPLPSHLAEKIVALDEFFRALKENESKRAAILAKAHTLLDQILLRQHERVSCRPFGWEDVCA